MKISAEQLPAPSGFEKTLWSLNGLFVTNGEELPYSGGRIGLQSLRTRGGIYVLLFDASLLGTSGVVQNLVREIFEHSSVRQFVLARNGARPRGDVIGDLEGERRSGVVHLPKDIHPLQVRKLVQELIGAPPAKSLLLSGNPEFTDVARRAGVNTITNRF